MMFLSFATACRRLVAAVACTAVLGFAASADAGIILQLEQVGGPGPTNFGPVASPPGQISFAGNFGDFSISGLFGDGDSMAGVSSTLSVSSLRVRLESGSNETLFIRVIANDFDDPFATLLSFFSTASASFAGGEAGNTVEFQSFFDPTNGLAFPVIGTPQTNLVLTSAGLPALDSDSDTATPILVNRGADSDSPFALGAILKITIQTVGSSAGFNGIATVGGPELITGTPEPTSLALLGLGGLGLAGGAIRRRRAARNTA